LKKKGFEDANFVSSNVFLQVRRSIANISYLKSELIKR